MTMATQRRLVGENSQNIPGLWEQVEQREDWPQITNQKDTTTTEEVIEVIMQSRQQLEEKITNPIKIGWKKNRVYIIIGRLAEGREERAQLMETNEHARVARATTTIVAKPGGSKAWRIVQARRKRKREEHQDRVERERLLERDEETLLQATATPITANVDNEETEQINQRIKIIKFQCTIDHEEEYTQIAGAIDKIKRAPTYVTPYDFTTIYLIERDKIERAREKLREKHQENPERLKTSEKNDDRLRNNAPHIQRDMGHATKRAKFTDDGEDEDGFNSGVEGKSGESRKGYDRRITPTMIRNILDAANRTIQFTLKRQEYTSTSVPSDALVVNRNKLGKQTNIQQLGETSWAIDYHRGRTIEVFAVLRQRLLQQGQTSYFTYDFETSQNLFVSMGDRTITHTETTTTVEEKNSMK
ncbi:Coat protein VP1/VP2 [Atta colombica]|uniref:Coat protein VP1/VP2 n=1 Tax=Atta colombica TaxID=520822 RepID=A0A151I4H1_9HYME|nr:Coat protein VP1/VP2 [Atta colombica]